MGKTLHLEIPKSQEAHHKKSQNARPHKLHRQAWQSHSRCHCRTQPHPAQRHSNMHLIQHFRFKMGHPQKSRRPSPLLQFRQPISIISTPNISMDFNNAPPGSGREKAHIGAIKAAREAGVTRFFYTSLAFGSESGAGVMRAHLRTEEFPKELQETEGVKVTVMREGLYNESWPLYLGYFDPKGDERGEVVLAGDGKISWTAIKDLGLASALVLVDGSGRFEGKTFYLSRREGPRSMSEIAKLVGEARGKEVSVRVVGREEYVETCVKRGIERASVEWWSSTYAALESGECLIDDPTLDELLASRGVKPTPVEDTLRGML